MHCGHCKTVQPNRYPLIGSQITLIHMDIYIYNCFQRPSRRHTHENVFTRPEVPSSRKGPLKMRAAMTLGR